MSDKEIQSFAREAARAGQFPLGAKGRRVKLIDTYITGDPKVTTTTETETTILECQFDNRSGYWQFLMLKDSGEIFSIRWNSFNPKIILIG